MEVTEDSDFTFKLEWKSRNVEKKSSNKGPTRSKSKDKNKVHSQDFQTKPKLVEVRVGQASAKQGSWTRLRERPTHQMEEDSLRLMGEPKRKHVGTEDECLESERKEKKVRLLEGTQQVDAIMFTNQVSAKVAGQPRRNQ